MNWSNILLIFNREVRDQLRDRRTLFMIFVLPILLYPFMGMSIFQLAQFVQDHPTRVLVIGQEELPKTPALLDGEQFAETWFHDAREASADKKTDKKPAAKAVRTAKEPNKARLLELTFAKLEDFGAGEPSGEQFAKAQRALLDGEYQAILYFPPSFGDRLAEFRRRLTSGDHASDKASVPDPKVYHNTAKKKSQITVNRVNHVLRNWREAIARENLQVAGMPATVVTPFKLDESDVADVRTRHAAMWSMVFPFLLLIWSVTGAFYPAIDLCAGEKERGTLETLLSSPAERSEIVWGKLLTIMLFSVGTVVLNLAAVGFTGWFLISGVKGMPHLGPPPLMAFVWLFMAVIPVAALFSALCLALAAFARSTKEGQYYLMPLFLVTLPLVALPMSPSFELTLGNSLIPITGVVLLLRSAIEGDYIESLRYLAPVVAVTAVCCLLAVRWAIDQFNRENVLFRESERFELGLWLRSLVRDRDRTPTVAAALMCGAVILLVKFFLGLVVAGRSVGPVAMVLSVQLLAILAPALLMALAFTRKPRQSLLLNKPRGAAVLAAAVLAVAFHPIANLLGQLVQWMYPVNEQVTSAMQGLLEGMPGIWTQLLLIAIVPAICEELAFRGFILSGLRRMGHKRLAILFSSVLFGLAHSIFQQQLLTFFVGMLIAYIAVQSGSLLPGLVFHAINNALVVGALHVTKEAFAENAVLRAVFALDAAGDATIRWQFAVAGGVVSLLVLAWFRSLPYQKSKEEVLQDAIERQSVEGMVTGQV